MNNDTFQWTDLLACEWAGYLEEQLKVKSIIDMQSILFQWKQSKLPKREWEIVSFITHSGQSILTKGDDGRFISKGAIWGALEKDCLIVHAIHSVRRLSDNEVFTVGDRVEKPMKGAIKFFQGFPNGNIHVNIRGVNDIDEYSGGGNDLLKSTPPEQPKKERIEVKEVGIESMLIKFEGRRLSAGKIEQVKAAIEKIVNGD